MEKYGFVYIWYDRKHKRYYIGSHWGTENDGYVCSSKWMMQAYKIRPQDFKRRILSRIYTSKKDLLEKEYNWLSLISDDEIKDKKYYNRTKHKNGHWMTQDYEKDIRTRISIKTKEAMARTEVQEKYKVGITNRNHRQDDPEIRSKKSESMKKTMAKKYPNRKVRDKFNSPEYKENMSNKTKELWTRPEHRESVGKKISEANRGNSYRKGQKNSEEHNKKIIESNRITNERKAKEKFERYYDSIISTMHLTCVAASREIGLNRAKIKEYRDIINKK